MTCEYGMMQVDHREAEELGSVPLAVVHLISLPEKRVL